MMFRSWDFCAQLRGVGGSPLALVSGIARNCAQLRGIARSWWIPISIWDLTCPEACPARAGEGSLKSQILMGIHQLRAIPRNCAQFRAIPDTNGDPPTPQFRAIQAILGFPRIRQKSSTCPQDSFVGRTREFGEVGRFPVLPENPH